MDRIELWLWEFTDEFGKRRTSRWRMSEENARLYKDAVRVPGSMEIRTPVTSSTSIFQRSPKKREDGQ